MKQAQKGTYLCDPQAVRSLAHKLFLMKHYSLSAAIHLHHQLQILVISHWKNQKITTILMERMATKIIDLCLQILPFLNHLIMMMGIQKKRIMCTKDAADIPPRLPPVTPRDFEPRREDQREWQQLPCRSGRTRNPPNCLVNTYREQRLPSDIERDIARDRYWRRAVGQDSDSNQTHPHAQPQSDTGSGQAPVTDVPYSNNQEEPDHPMTGTDNIGYIIKIAWEGGINLM
jgi:hypothetical protein